MKKTLKWVLIIGGFCLINLSLMAQQVYINELSSSNFVFVDEDGDTPDWFELRNSSATEINLLGWSITDRKNDTIKWVFPDVTLPVDGYKFFWASGKNRIQNGFVRTFISEGDPFQYIVPQSNITGWTSLGFDDTAWAIGNSGFGYSDGDDNTVVPNGVSSVFMRRKFTVSNITDINKIILDIDYDDGFVAYINGVEIARANIVGVPPAFNQYTWTDREAQMYQGGSPERHEVNNPSAFLQEGENVLAIQVHNVGAGSSDMTMIPFLSAVYNSPSTDGAEPPAVLQLTDFYTHVNFSIKNEYDTLYLYDPAGQLVHSLYGGKLLPGVSKGLDPVSYEKYLYENPTPGEVNSTQPSQGNLNEILTFSHDGGVVSNSFSLNVSCSVEGVDLRYTTDGTKPTLEDPLFVAPMEITNSSNIWIRAFKTDFVSGAGEMRSYTFQSAHDLPVLNLVTDPNNLFQQDTGIYVLGKDYPGGDFPYFGSNIWNDWERPAYVSLYEKDGSLGMSLPVGIKIFGGWSRAQAQRSFSVFARGKYGVNAIDYPIFPNNPYSEYQAFVMRNSGNDWKNTMMRDATLTGLMKSADLEIQAYKPVATYINDQYWGIYNLREKVNEHYLASRHQVNPDEVDLLERNGVLIHGDQTGYQNLFNFVNNSNLTNDELYKQIQYEVDIDNFILYQLAQVYFDNTDWPGNNIKFWNHPNGKWRWILYDTDFGFGIWDPGRYSNNTLAFAMDPNGPGWPNPTWSTLFLRKFSENEQFRHKFINRFCDELNTRFKSNFVSDQINENRNRISGEIQRHFARWEGSYDHWSNQVNNMKIFADRRPNYVFQFITQQFDLQKREPLEIAINDTSRGYVKVNFVDVRENNWFGMYFPEVPITITAIPEKGFKFVKWEHDINATDPQLKFNLNERMSLKAVFEPNDVGYENIVINEINYNSPGNLVAGDWVELHNPNEGYVDISGWIMTDSNPQNRFRIPDGTVIKGGGYLVLVRNRLEFTLVHPEMKDFVGDFKFGLGNSGDHVMIYNDEGALEDEVAYFDVAPWPVSADGTGPTLELTNPDIDNSIASSWATYAQGGSPGRKNGLELDGKPTFQFSVYPNPVRGDANTNVYFILEEKSKVKIRLVDIMGRIHKNAYFGELPEGRHLIALDVDGLQSGVYIVQFQTEIYDKAVRISVF